MKKKTLFRCKSHPQKLLVRHLEDVYRIGTAKLDESSRQGPPCRRVIAQVCLLLHDFGKATVFFQDYLSVRTEFAAGTLSEKEYRERVHAIGKDSRHGVLSALFCYFLLTRKLGFSPAEAFPALNAVSKHHGHLADFADFYVGSSDLADYRRIAGTVAIEEINYLLRKYFKITYDKDEFDLFLANYKCRRMKKEIENGLSFNDYFSQSYLFSLLVFSDKKECILGADDAGPGEGEIPFSLVDDYKTTLPYHDNAIYRIRNAAFLEVKRRMEDIGDRDRVCCLNLPTGAGKTLTVLHAALMLREKFRELRRIIYCLPYTSIIDQVVSLVREELLKTSRHDTVLAHHHLVEFKYKTDEGEYDINRSEFLITSWESEIVITTFYQLLHSVLSGRNENLRKLCSFRNSVVILDEVQGIPFHYWQLVRSVFLAMAELYNIRFILSTATMPLIFSKEEVYDLVPGKEGYFRGLDRIVLDLSLFERDMQAEELVSLLLKEITEENKKSYLIILNTIKSSLAVYTGLREQLEGVVYLSTNIVPVHRLERIAEIKQCSSPQVVVSTQLVEAGVDIDFDVVYRDFAPLDSLFQACGRCNRNNLQEKGRVKIIRLKDTHGHYLWRYIYDIVIGHITKDILSANLGPGRMIAEKEFHTLAQAFYTRINSTKSDSQSRDLMALMSKLQYESAFTGKEAFRLISNEIPGRNVFVCVDKDAEDIWEEYRALKKQKFTDEYERNAVLKNHRKKMAKYVITVREKTVKESEGYDLIPADSLALEYDLETGYIPESLRPAACSF